MWDKELILQRELETYSSEQLRTMLDAETQKEIPDPGAEKEKAAAKLFQKRIRARRKHRLWQPPHFSESGICGAGALSTVCPGAPAG